MTTPFVPRARASVAGEMLEQLVLLSAGGGTRDAPSLLRFAQTVAELRAMPGATGVFRAKMASAGGWAGLLFSDRRHRRYDWPDRTGAARIREFIAEDLAAARLHAPRER